MVHRFKGSGGKIAAVVAIVCVAIFFVFVATRALTLMSRSEHGRRDRPIDFSDVREMSPRELRELIRALKSLGIEFDEE